MNNQKKAYLYGLAVVALWSTVASAFKLALRHLDHLELLLWSDLFATLVLGSILLASGRLGAVFRCTKRQVLRSFMLGVLNPFLYYLVLFKAYELLPAQEAQPLNFTWALTLTLLSVPLLKQRLHANDFAGLLVGYAGVLVIATGGHLLDFRISNPLGTALALASTVVWALYWIYNTNDSRDPAVCLFTSFAFSLVPLLICFPLLRDFRVPSPQGLLGAAYVGLFEMSITFILWLTALRLTESTAKIAGLIFLSPPFSLALIHLTVGESIKPSTIAGLALILGGITIQKYARFPRTGKRVQPPQ